MTSDGSAYSRFQRALTTRNPLLIRTTAADLPRIDLGDAHQIVLELRPAENRRGKRVFLGEKGRVLAERTVDALFAAETRALNALENRLQDEAWPGDPPISTSEPGTTPPPRIRSSSPIPVRSRS